MQLSNAFLNFNFMMLQHTSTNTRLKMKTLALFQLIITIRDFKLGGKEKIPLHLSLIQPSLKKNYSVKPVSSSLQGS